MLFRSGGALPAWPIQLPNLHRHVAAGTTVRRDPAGSPRSVYVLKEQGAKDQGCYNYLKDIMRIEEFRDKADKFIEGYTIKITGEMSYLRPPIKVNCTYAEFSIDDGSIKTGCMNWSTNTGKGTMRGMEAPIVLTGMYPINWKEYSKVDDTNSGTFMYLVNTVTKDKK